MRLRDWLVDLWEGLVWFGLVFYYIHTSFLTCLHGLNATNEVVMCFLPPLLFLSSALARCKAA